jgi:hypothetical protein
VWIIREQTIRRRAERRTELTQEESIQAREINAKQPGHQESGVHYDLWVQRLATSQSSKNKSTVILYLQCKKYVSFAMRLNGKVKQQTVAVVAEDLCLLRSVNLFKISNFCWKTHCF